MPDLDDFAGGVDDAANAAMDAIEFEPTLPEGGDYPPPRPVPPLEDAPSELGEEEDPFGISDEQRKEEAENAPKAAPAA